MPQPNRPVLRKSKKSYPKIDARVQKLRECGLDEAALFVEMAEYMPDFKRLMDIAGQGGMNEWCGRFPDLYRYTSILENVARGIAEGDIEVPRD